MKQPQTPTSSARYARTRRVGIAVGAVALLLTVVAGLATVLVQRHARATLEVAHKLAHLDALANTMSRLEWMGTAGGLSPSESQQQIAAVVAETRSALDDLPGGAPGSGEVKRLAGQFAQAVTAEVAARAKGDNELAKTIDEEQVDPTFALLDEAITAAGATATRDARRSGFVGDAATIAILMLAAIGLAILFRRFDRTRKIAYQAYRDQMTGLANRTLLTDRMSHALTLAARRGDHVAAVFLDLDDFKSVNDSMGHAAGDQLLIEAARRIVGCARESDTVARFGGDEFAILLEGALTPDGVQEFCERLRQALRAPVEIAGRPIVPRATIGYAFADVTADDPEAVLRNADLAMYSGKRDSKGGITAFDPEMHRHLLERLELEADLRDALSHGELYVQYQPLVALDTGAMTSTEALLRWNHPRLGVVPPATFIPMAERTGAIHEIGAWILNEACRQTADWQRRHPLEPPLTISVNVSPVQFQDPQFVAVVRDALTASGLQPRHLTLEITESVIAERHATLGTHLERISALGVQLAIDDFGTGYSSLSTLHEFPVNVLKIDKSFVDDVPDHVERLALLRSIVELGRSLGLTTVAEGIEQFDQATALQDLGCIQAQGYLYSRPQLASDIEGLFARGTLTPSREVAAASPAPVV